MPTKNTQKTSIDIKPENVVKPISTNKKVDTTGSIKTVPTITVKKIKDSINTNVHTNDVQHTPKSIPSTSTKKISDSIFFPTSERPGTLIIVEGSDGSGKSTQLLIAKNLLESNGFFCVHSEWNSSLKIHEMQKTLKKKNLHMPAAVFDMVFASDFIERYLSDMRGALRAGMVVLCDRYMYTALARGYARGLRMKELKPFYDAFFPVPDMSFYFRISVDVAAERAIGRNPLKHYEAGMDVRYSENIVESFKKFQTKVIEGYDILAAENNMYVIDGTAPVYQTTPLFISHIADYFEKKYAVKLMGVHR